MSTLREASKIYYALLKNGQINKDKERELYRNYINNTEIQTTLNEILDETQYDLVVRAENIYLIPRLGNEAIRFSIETDTLLRGIGKRTDGLDKRIDYYISVYLVALIFNEFFNKIAPVHFLTVDKIIMKATERLKKAANQEDIEEVQEELGYRIIDIYKAWEAKGDTLQDIENGGKDTTSFKCRYGCVRKVMTYLTEADLIACEAIDGEIKPTDKLKDLMNYYFLNNARRAEVEEILFNTKE